MPVGWCFFIKKTRKKRILLDYRCEIIYQVWV